MLTPAEELGLSGSNLASRVRQAFFRFPERRLVELIQRMREESERGHLFYLRDGQFETIRILPRPLTVLPDQVTYIHYVTLTILNALKRLPEMYLTDPAIRQALPLAPDEEQWLADSWGSSQRDYNPVFGRLDAMIDFTSPAWKESLKFVEPNLSGVGGIHLVPTTERIMADVVLPALMAQDRGLRLEIGTDVRELLMQEIHDHLEALGGRAENLCFVEPKYAKTGPDEQEALAQYFHERHGMKVMHADPSELTTSDGEVYYGGDRVDLAYRDYEVRDLLALAREGIDVEPLRVLFRQNRIISSIAGDFDHKSCWEILTDPQLAQKHFNPDERQVFKRHILWTRILSERKTRLPDGQTGDLVKYARGEHERLVLKPNRSYGGDRILIGPMVERAEWEAAIDTALADPEAWVVQQLASTAVDDFPILGADGHIHFEPFYTVMGFAPTRYGLAIMGRASQKHVVNVAQRGGMVAVVIGRPPGQLVGPEETPSGQSRASSTVP